MACGQVLANQLEPHIAPKSCIIVKKLKCLLSTKFLSLNIENSIVITEEYWPHFQIFSLSPPRSSSYEKLAQIFLWSSLWGVEEKLYLASRCCMRNWAYQSLTVSLLGLSIFSQTVLWQFFRDRGIRDQESILSCGNLVHISAVSSRCSGMYPLVVGRMVFSSAMGKPICSHVFMKSPSWRMQMSMQPWMHNLRIVICSE